MLRVRSVSWLLLLAAGALLVGCSRQAIDELAKAAREAAETAAAESDAPATRPTTPLPPPVAGETIRIASFNIQVFGESKSQKPEVMDVLAQVVRRFDIVAIQELRAKDQSIVPKFVEQINAEGARYTSLIGPRLGRTVSKEQYVYIWDTRRIEIDDDSVYTVDDPQDLLHREPLVARFRVRHYPEEEAFTFTLVNIHTDPDETDQELDALGGVFRRVRQSAGAEDDIIVLGDLNVDEKHLGALGALPGMAWAIRGLPTNTRGNKSYDNLVFDGRATREYTLRSGVLDLMREFNLTMDEALEVSDHLPVWAEFHSREAAPDRLAGGDAATFQ